MEDLARDIVESSCLKRNRFKNWKRKEKNYSKVEGRIMSIKKGS